jgi:hypothetical protein
MNMLLFCYNIGGYRLSTSFNALLVDLKPLVFLSVIFFFFLEYLMNSFCLLTFCWFRCKTWDLTFWRPAGLFYNKFVANVGIVI